LTQTIGTAAPRNAGSKTRSRSIGARGRRDVGALLVDQTTFGAKIVLHVERDERRSRQIDDHPLRPCRHAQRPQLDGRARGVDDIVGDAPAVGARRADGNRALR